MMRVAAELKNGEMARVVRVIGAGEVGRRLLEMGVTPGVVLRSVVAAPLGDPIEFELRGYRLSLRRCEAQQIEIDRESNS